MRKSNSISNSTTNTLIVSLSNTLRSRLFLLILAVLVTVSMSIAYVVSVPRDYEMFMSLSTLGSNMKASDYYPDGRPDIGLGDNVRWYIQVYNNMGNTEYIAVRVKILNSEQEAPDDNMHTPSSVEHVYEFRNVIGKGETITIPFEWSIASILSIGNEKVIKEMVINGDKVEVNASTVEGKNFRIVFELWRYNPDSKEFEFSWLDSLNNKRSVWNQIWFNVK